MKTSKIRKIIFTLVVVCFALAVLSPLTLEAQVQHKKAAFPTLSSDQYQRIASLHPDATKPVYVMVKFHVVPGDVVKVDLVNGCGVPEVDQLVLKWAWNTYHYERNFSGLKMAKIRVNSPIVQSPGPHLSWRAWRELYKADPFKQGKQFVARFNIVIRQGKITDVQLIKSSGLPLVDQEFGEFIRQKWVAAPGANQNYPMSMIAHRNYYPG
ncbi:MAG: hypothetical protein JO279_11980 [Verrucomicrobia bacterium]|nr:hypothetical protein [Verrucomicrobiota bacterium]